MDESTARSRHPDSIGQAFLWALLPSLVLFLIAPSLGDAQQQVVTTNITSSGLGTFVQPPSDGIYNIIEGTRPGNGPNLFHSFGDFSVGSGDIANFLNNTGLPTTNILGRVTGGNVSNIYGTIQTTDFGNANLFLVNPSGIVLGPTGSVNVTGSVSFTTTQYLRLFDGVNSANFYANPANDGLANSVLAVAPVVDFGFLSPAAYGFLTAPDPSATITVQGSALRVPIIFDSETGQPKGSTLSLVGGDINIIADPDTGTPAALTAPSGQINLVSLTSPGEILFPSLATGPNINGVPVTTMGTVTIKEGAMLDVSGQLDVDGNLIGNGNSGTVFVRGGQLVVTDASTIQANTVGAVDGASAAVDIQVSQDVMLTNGASISSTTSGPSSGGALQIIAKTVQLTAGATLITATNGDGNAGNITLNVGTLTLADGASINSNNNSNSTFGLGQGGNVTVQGHTGDGSAADSVAISNGSTINTVTSGTGTDTSGTGTGGKVQLTARSLTLENGSQILTATVDGGGVGGDVALKTDTVSLMGGSLIWSISQSPTPGSGHGGNVIVQGLPKAEFEAATSVALSGGSSLFSLNVGFGEGGEVDITAISLTMEEPGTTVMSSTNDVGLGGDIVVGVQHATLSGGAMITTLTGSNRSDTQVAATVTVQGLGDPGNMADSVDLAGAGSGIASDVGGTGRAGDVTVLAKAISMTDGAVIQAGTPSTPGAGGNVTIGAGSVDISGRSSISSQASEANAGQVTITANELTLDNGSIATKTSSSTGGQGGDVKLDVGTVSLSNAATVNSNTSGTGQAGDITMNVGTLSLANGSSISSASTGTAAVTNPDGVTTEPPGTAGYVTITATGSFTSDASSIATSAAANRGGDISITAQNVQLSNGTLITANSEAPLEVTKLVLKMDANGSPVLDENGQPVLDTVRVGDGNAGNITITSDSNVVMQNSSVTTEASAASGGSIEINASDTGMIQLINSNVSTSVGGLAGESDGGNIKIDPQFVLLTNSQILAQAIAGAGGDITIISKVFIADPFSKEHISASSQLGISGTVNIQSPLQNVGGELTALTEEFSSAAALLAQQCAARAADGKFSTFVIVAREGLPVEPGGFLASPSLTSELLGSRLSGGQASHSQLSAFTGLFPKYDARPIQLAKLGNTCRR